MRPPVTETDPEVLAAQARLQAHRRAHRAPPPAPAPALEGEGPAEGAEKALSAPSVFHTVLAHTIDALRASGRTDDEVREEIARRARVAQRKRFVENADLREVPPDIRDTILRPVVPRTPALGVLVQAAAWREARGGRCGVLIVLAGSTGTGKSVAGGYFVAAWPSSALYVTAATVGALPDTEWQENHTLRRKWETVDLLVLDELGVEWSQKGARRVLTLMMQRYTHGRMTVCSTNLTSGEFERGYLEQDAHARARLMSRMEHHQARGGREGGLPWWWETGAKGLDYRDPQHDPFDALARGELQPFTWRPTDP